MSVEPAKREYKPPRYRGGERNIGQAERQRRKPDAFQTIDSFYRRTGTTPTRAENEHLACTDRNELARRNIPLVLYTVSNLLRIGPQKRRRGFNPGSFRIGFVRDDRGKADDLIQDGILGLIRAAETYDPTRGFTFATYALTWIVSAVQMGESRQAIVHLPVEVGRAIRVEPETLSRSQRDSAYRVIGGFSDLDAPIAGGDPFDGRGVVETLADTIEQHEPEQEDAMLARSALDALTPLERKVIEHRFGLVGPPLDLQATGTQLGMTRREVRETERHAMRKMQDAT